MPYETPAADDWGAEYSATIRHDPTNTGPGRAVFFKVTMPNRAEATTQQLKDAFQALIDLVDAGTDFTVTEAIRSYPTKEVVTLTFPTT